MKFGFSDIYSRFVQCLKCFLPLLLVGCAAPAVYLVDPLSETTVVSPQQGYVTARVVNAGNIAFPFNYLTITPKNLNESADIKPTRLSSIGRVYGDSTVFASPVAAGEYSLSSIRSYHSSGERWYSRWVEGDIALGTFEVKPGVLTDLGTLIYYPKVQEDRYIDMLLRSPGEGTSDTLKSVLPFFKFDSNHIISWNEDGNDGDRTSLYSSAVQNPVVHNQRYLAPDGSVYFIGKLGAILKRDPDAEWILDAVDTDSDLVSIAANDVGDVLVGGEQGALFAKMNNRPWLRIPLSEKYTVRDIVFYSEKLADIVVLDADKLKVFRGRLDEPLTRWKVMASYTPSKGWLDQYGNSQGVGVQKKKKKKSRLIKSASLTKVDNVNYLFVSVETGSTFSIFNYTKLNEYTYDPDTWSVKKSKGYAKGIDNILMAGESRIGVKKAGFWVSWDSYFSWDSSQNKWVKISTRFDKCPGGQGPDPRRCQSDNRSSLRFRAFTFLSIPVFTSPSTAIAFVRTRQPSTGFMNATPGEFENIVVKTDDGGRSWKRADIEIPNKYCTKTVPEVKDSLLVSCVGVSSDFYQSNDNGKTWEHVREHENI